MPASTVQDILTELIPRMEEPREPARGIAVIVGAGCSMQYGLPSFYELLLSFYREHHQRFRDLGDKPEFETLRGKLNDSLRTGGPNELRRKLAPYLTRVKGADCRAYRLLARLVKKGLIHTVVNMNFDILLEEAFEAEGVEYGVSQSFQPRTQNVMVYKPHGSLRAEGGSPVLSIEHSRVFEKHQEGEAAAALLSQNHVLVLGYKGGDAKILDALRSPGENLDLAEHKLFVSNVDGPGVDLTLVQESRNSKDLSLIGEDASFASFMESVYAYFDPAAGSSPFQEERPARVPDYLTRTERVALEASRRLALRIRSTINVAEYNSFRLEEHADDLFHRIIELSRACNIPLTEAEKYLVRCAACFHDLGFLWARSGHNCVNNPGLQLLHRHGQQTHKLIQRLLKAEYRQITPSCYDQESSATMVHLVAELCRLHTFQVGEDFKSLVPPQRFELSISGILVPIRFDLAHALFVLAEETLSGQPWTPNADAAFTGEEDQPSPIEDPVTDLYWFHQGTDLHFQVGRGILIPSTSSSHSASWLLQRVKYALDNLNEVTARYEGMEIRLESQAVAKATESTAVSAALTDALKGHIKSAPQGSPGWLPNLLDLLAIYVLPIPGTMEEPIEPRVRLSSKIVTEAIRKIEPFSLPPSSSGILGLYFTLKHKGPDSTMEERFCRSFEKILYPAWRFLAQHWSLGVYSLSFAHTVLTFGSSRFRPEIAIGIQSLARDRILPGKLEPESFYGHSGCMQCTGLLLHILSTIRQRFAPQEIEKLVPQLDDYVRGLLRFVLSDKLQEEDWLGLFEERGNKRVQSISYLAWAIQGLIQLVNVDETIRQESAEGWLEPLCGVKPGTLRRLICSKWADLCSLSESRVTASISEGGFSHGLHNVCLCWLQMRSFERGSMIPSWLDWACVQAMSGDRGEDGRFTLIPALIARSEVFPEHRKSLVETVEGCLANPLWIAKGENRGSWGYNASKTQELTSALVAFWLYAFEHRETFEPLFS